MAMSVVYTTVNGMILHENRGGVETEYVPDPLGSLVKCKDTSGAYIYNAEYWPYGEIRTEAGTNPSPWNFVGLLGYFRDVASRLYVRARYLRTDLARWMTTDMLWPNEPAFNYCRLQSVFLTDPSGMQAGGAVLQNPGNAGAIGMIIGGIGLIIGSLSWPLIIAGICIIALVAALALPAGPPCPDDWRKKWTGIYHKFCDHFKREFSTPFNTRVCKETDLCPALCWKLLINNMCGSLRIKVRDRCDTAKDVYDNHSTPIMTVMGTYYNCLRLVKLKNCDCTGVEQTINVKLDVWARGV